MHHLRLGLGEAQTHRFQHVGDVLAQRFGVGAAGIHSDTIKVDRPGFFQYERSCNHNYTLSVTSTLARAIKGDAPTDGKAWCDGHAWLRVMGDSLGEWRHDAREVKLTSPKGKFRWAYIKGCSDCYAYIVYPK